MLLALEKKFYLIAWLIGISVKRRPTIPFSSWKFALDLENTRQVQKHPDMPAFNCTCDYCKFWKKEYKGIIPAETLHELDRLGIDVAHPNELYGSKNEIETTAGRAIYHLVGKILSGPNGTIFDEKLNSSIDNYTAIRQEPWFSVRVSASEKSTSPSPIIKDCTDVIVLDFRFELRNA